MKRQRILLPFLADHIRPPEFRAMRFLHTADWHLGRYLHGLSLLEDQAHVLDQLVDIARSSKVDAVMIAGDVHDRAVAPADAIALLDDVVSRLVIGAGVRVILIAGNHDSPDRVSFGGRVAERQGLVLRGTLGHLEPVLFEDAHGTVAVHPLPYLEPAFVRDVLPARGAGTLQDHQTATAAMVDLMRQRCTPGQRNVLLAHAFVAGGSESESERPLTVGGSGAVSPSTFEGFDYVALGHLHRPQCIGRESVQYSGSLLKYSFNEVEHRKSVSLVEIGPGGQCAVERIALRPRHDLRTVRGTLAELLARPAPDLPRDDYLRAELTDREPLLDPRGRLREAYPNLLDIQFTELGSPHASGLGAYGDHRRRTPEDLFRAFYRDMLGEEAGERELAIFSRATQAASDPEREVHP